MLKINVNVCLLEQTLTDVILIGQDVKNFIHFASGLLPHKI